MESKAPRATIRQQGDTLVVVAPTPGRLRRALLGVVVSILFLGLFVSPLLSYLFFEDRELSVATLGMVSSHWMFWAALLVLGGLLALDTRCRRRLVWGRDLARTSWLFGPIEVFVSITRRKKILSLTIEHIGPGGGGDNREGELQRWMRRRPSWGGYWIVGWLTGSRTVNRRIESSHEIARFDTEKEARELEARLRGWPPANGIDGVRVEADSAVEPAPGEAPEIWEEASTAVRALLRLPLLFIVAPFVVLVGLAGEALNVDLGRIEPRPVWDGVAPGELEHLHWRLHSVLQPMGTEIYRFPRGSLQALVRFVDADGNAHRRPLAISKKVWYGPLEDLGDPELVIEELAKAGLVPEQIRFAVPSSVFPVSLDEGGALDFRGVSGEAFRASAGEGREDRTALLNALDFPDVFLPVLWSQPTLRSGMPVLYRSGNLPAEPVWPAPHGRAMEADTTHVHLFFYIGGLLGIAVGGWLFVHLTSRGRALGGIAIWIVISGSAFWWGPHAIRFLAWVGIERGASQTARHLIVDRCCARRLEVPTTAGRDLIVGHWSPARSREAEVLGLLGLLAPPENPLPDFDSARKAVAERASGVLAGLEPPARRAFLETYDGTRLWNAGGSWLNDQVVAPAVCRWRDDPRDGAALAQAFPRAFQASVCDR